jgi:hypothetical protein
MGFRDRGKGDINKLLERVRDYLVAQAAANLAAGVEGWTLTFTVPDPATSVVGDIYLVHLPETPQEGTVIVPTGGPILPEDPTRRPSFQIQVRTARADVGLPKSQQINRLLNNQWNVLAGFPGQIVATSEAGVAFKDDSGNLIFTLNYTITSTCPN